MNLTLLKECRLLDLGNLRLEDGDERSYQDILTFPEWITFQQRNAEEGTEAVLLFINRQDLQSSKSTSTTPQPLNKISVNLAIFKGTSCQLSHCQSLDEGLLPVSLLSLRNSNACEPVLILGTSKGDVYKLTWSEEENSFGSVLIWSVPLLPMAEEEEAIWSRVKSSSEKVESENGESDWKVIVKEFQALEEAGNVPLSEQALALLALVKRESSKEESSELVLQSRVKEYFARQLGETKTSSSSSSVPDYLIAMKELDYSPLKGVSSFSCLVIATERQMLYICKLGSRSNVKVIEQFYVSEKISLLDCSGHYEMGAYRILVVTRDSTVYYYSKKQCFRVVKCEFTPTFICSIPNSEEICVGSSLCNEIMWLNYQGQRLCIHREEKDGHITAIEVIPIAEAGGKILVAVALSTGLLKFLSNRGRILASIQSSEKSPISLLKYGAKFGRESGVFFVGTRGSLAVKLLSRSYQSLLLSQLSRTSSMSNGGFTIGKLSYPTLKRANESNSANPLKFWCNNGYLTARKTQIYTDLVRDQQERSGERLLNWKEDELRLYHLTQKTILQIVEERKQPINEDVKLSKESVFDPCPLQLDSTLIPQEDPDFVEFLLSLRNQHAHEIIHRVLIFVIIDPRQHQFIELVNENQPGQSVFNVLFIKPGETKYLPIAFSIKNWSAGTQIYSVKLTCQVSSGDDLTTRTKHHILRISNPQ